MKKLFLILLLFPALACAEEITINNSTCSGIYYCVDPSTWNFGGSANCGCGDRVVDGSTICVFGTVYFKKAGSVIYSGACVPSEPAHCGNGVQDGDETGIDCGGSCPPCQPYCPVGYHYEERPSSDGLSTLPLCVADSGGVPPDGLDNCPDGYIMSNGVCVPWKVPTYAGDGYDNSGLDGSAPPDPWNNHTESNSNSSTSSNGDGTATNTTTTTTINPDGSTTTTTTTTIINETTNNIISQTTVTDSTVPPPIDNSDVVAAIRAEGSATRQEISNEAQASRDHLEQLVTVDPGYASGLGLPADNTFDPSIDPADIPGENSLSALIDSWIQGFPLITAVQSFTVTTSDSRCKTDEIQVYGQPFYVDLCGWEPYLQPFGAILVLISQVVALLIVIGKYKLGGGE